MGEPKRQAEVSRAPRAPCLFCHASTQVRIIVRNLEDPDLRESSQRICRDCFKAIVDHLMEARSAK
jgi:hypothetical protein